MKSHDEKPLVIIGAGIAGDTKLMAYRKARFSKNHFTHMTTLSMY